MRIPAAFALSISFAICLQSAHSQTQIEDPQLRARAVAILERADHLRSPVWPMNEEEFTFRIANPEPGYPPDGFIGIGVAAPRLKRWEVEYGPYHLTQIQHGIEIAGDRRGREPASVILVRRMIPVNLVHFDQSDFIRAITAANVDGVEAICIDLDTITGVRHEANRVCVDKRDGFLIYQKVGDRTIKESNFYPFNNGYLPAHIEVWTGENKVLEIESRVVVRTEFPADYFDYPPGAKIAHACNSFMPAYAAYTPQRVAKGFSETAIDIVVRGFIDEEASRES